MEPFEYIALASALVQGLKILIPQVRDAINGGALTAEQEAVARATYANMRALGGDLYSGPEYELSGR